MLQGSVASVLAATLVITATARADSAPPPPIEIEEQRVKDVFVVRGSFTVNTTQQMAWDVITDYAALPKLVPSIERTEVREGSSDETLVEVEGKQQVLWFTRKFHLLLEVEKDPTGTVTTHDVSGRSFAVFEGKWELKPGPDGIRVDYRLRAKPKGSAPAFIVAPVIRSDVKEILSSMRDEMVRRTRQK
jgi:carbon monoxide dehydrogenase subunit G